MVVVLITGANRGIGLYLARLYAKAGHTVVAAVRKVESMPEVQGAVVVPYDAGDEEGAKRMVEALKEKGVDKLDVVIANAGVNLSPALFNVVSASELAETFRINVIGPVLLFQAALPLLGNKGTYVALSSGMGSSTLTEYPMTGSYSMSKAALNHFTKKLHIEQPELTAFSVSPGWIATDMGSQGAAWYGLDKTVHDMDETLPQLFELINGATRDKVGGKFVNYDGEVLPF
ncbi:hypothetical protein Q5752_006357 [Cryptotrichosporon argae]